MIRTLLLLCFLFCSSLTYGQVGIGTTTPDPSAQLDVVSTNKGLLVPRVASTADVTGIPAKGLVVYQTSGAEGFYVYDGTAWHRMVTASEVFTPAYAYGYNSQFHHANEAGNERFFIWKTDGFTIPADLSSVTPINAGTYLITYKYHRVSGSWYYSYLTIDGMPVPSSEIEGTDGKIVAADVIVDLPALAKVALVLTSGNNPDLGVTFSSLTITRLK